MNWSFQCRFFSLYTGALILAIMFGSVVSAFSQFKSEEANSLSNPYMEQGSNLSRGEFQSLRDRLRNFIRNQNLVLVALEQLAIHRRAAGEPGWDNVLAACDDVRPTFEKADSLIVRIDALFGVVDTLGFLGRFSGFLGSSFSQFNSLSQTWADAVRNLDNVAQVTADHRGRTVLTAQVSSSSDSFPEAEYFVRDRRWHPLVSISLTNLVGITELVKGVFETGSNQVISLSIVVAAFGAGVGFNLSIVASVPEAIVGVVKLVADNFKFFDGAVDGAEVLASYQRLGHIHNDMETARKIAIEDNLSGHGSHPHAIASYQLPEAFGGYLEEVRDIVRQTIDDMLAAGEDVRNAENEYLQGVAYFGSMRYKKAYDKFSKAYHPATKK